MSLYCLCFQKLFPRGNGYETSAYYVDLDLELSFCFLLQYVNGEKNAFVEFYAPCTLTPPSSISHHPSHLLWLFFGLENGANLVKSAT